MTNYDSKILSSPAPSISNLELVAYLLIWVIEKTYQDLAWSKM